MVAAGINKYTIKDIQYKIPAATITISKLGPSGSLKNQNINLDKETDINPRIIKEVFFELKYMFVILFRLTI